jgi:hypothetical protein
MNVSSIVSGALEASTTSGGSVHQAVALAAFKSIPGRAAATV